MAAERPPGGRKSHGYLYCWLVLGITYACAYDGHLERLLLLFHRVE
jgi:hypothetical protein